jgi:hypothetical protein
MGAFGSKGASQENVNAIKANLQGVHKTLNNVSRKVKSLTDNQHLSSSSEFVDGSRGAAGLAQGALPVAASRGGNRKRRTHTSSRRNRRNTKKNRKNRKNHI